MISVIIPTFNEDKIVIKTLKALDKIADQKFEVIISDGGSTDRTIYLVKKNIKKFSYSLKLHQSSAKNRAGNMNAGAKLAKGDILLFLHADTLLPKYGLKMIETRMKNKKVVGGGFFIKFKPSSFIIKFIQWRSNIRINLFHVIFGDQAMFIQKKLFKKLKGFPSIPLMEDIMMSKLMRRAGQLAIISDPVISLSRRITANGPVKMLFIFNLLPLLYFFRIDLYTIANIYKGLRKQ